MMEEMVYLDHAAATPVDERVLRAMQPYMTQHFFNPSSPYAPALQVRRDYEAAKDTIAQCIGAKGGELIVTAGATESVNLAFSGISGHVVTANIEHHAVLAAAKRHAHTLVESDEKGIVSPKAIKDALTSSTQLVSVALANNELGTVQPLREIAAVLQQEREARMARGDTTPLYLHSDASQGAGQLDIHVSRLGVDMLTLNAAKVYGPKQVGVLWAANHVKLTPQIIGGGQERGLRSGTENVAGAIGFAEALSRATNRRKAESERLTVLRDRMQQAFVNTFPQSVVSGNQKRRLPGHLHISFPFIDAERLIFTLEMRGVLVATGSACAANKGTRSHVLTAIKLAPEVADGSLRISLGRLTDENTVASAIRIITEEVTREYERTGRSV